MLWEVLICPNGITVMAPSIHTGLRQGLFQHFETSGCPQSLHRITLMLGWNGYLLRTFSGWSPRILLGLPRDAGHLKQHQLLGRLPHRHIEFQGIKCSPCLQEISQYHFGVYTSIPKTGAWGAHVVSISSETRPGILVQACVTSSRPKPIPS